MYPFKSEGLRIILFFNYLKLLLLFQLLEWQIPVWQHCEWSTITATGNHCCYKTSDGVTLCPNNLSIIFRGDFKIMNLSIQISMVYQL